MARCVFESEECENAAGASILSLHRVLVVWDGAKGFVDESPKIIRMFNAEFNESGSLPWADSKSVSHAMLWRPFTIATRREA